jgi:hypothetical protein
MQVYQMNDNNNRFEFYSSRLHFIEVTTDQFVNIEVSHYLRVFESHVYGVSLQYNRIKTDLIFPKPEDLQRVPGPQAGLDIYYYTLTWDKLKKIYEKLKAIINRLQQTSSSFPNQFISAFRHWKRRIDHLFLEFDIEIRNEYEHPSLESYSIGNIIVWGNIVMDGLGNIKAHVGKEKFAIIKKEHCDRMNQLRIDLFDLFIKHFSEKPLTQELLKSRAYIEDNIDSLLKELTVLDKVGKRDEFNELLHHLLMYEVFFMRESMPLTDKVRTKIYSVIWPNPKKAVKAKKSATAADTVLAIINRSKKGVSTATLAEKTGFDNKKITNIVFMLRKQGKVKSVGRGVYVKA